MRKVLGMVLLLAGTSTFAIGGIGVGSAGSAVALLAGTLLVIRGRRRK